MGANRPGIDRNRCEGRTRSRDEADVTRRGVSTRRRFLRTGAVTALSLLAGCTEDVGTELPQNEKWPLSELYPSLPFPTRSDRFEDILESAASQDVPDVAAFTDVVEERVPRLESIEERRDVLSVEYVTAVRLGAGIGDDVAAIAGAYAALVATGYDAYALGTTILEPEFDPVGSAVVYTSWATDYDDGRYTTAEYGELVGTTIESTRHPPTIEVEPDD